MGGIDAPWYREAMSGNYKVVMGERGRLVVPADVRARHDLAEGSPLTLIDTEEGIVLLTREQLHARVKAQLEGHDLVADLIADRRREAAVENAGPDGAEANGGRGGRDAAA